MRVPEYGSVGRDLSQIGPKAVGTSAPLVLLHCHLAVHSGSDRDALLMDRLPSSRRVTSITAHRRLRLFKGGPTTWDGPPSALSREQMDALALVPALTPGRRRWNSRIPTTPCSPH